MQLFTYYTREKKTRTNKTMNNLIESFRTHVYETWLYKLHTAVLLSNTETVNNNTLLLGVCKDRIANKLEVIQLLMIGHIRNYEYMHTTTQYILYVVMLYLILAYTSYIVILRSVRTYFTRIAYII